MNETQTFEQPYVFGLDIGTRNVVGTVGYKEGNEFIVVAQYVAEHEDWEVEFVDFSHSTMEAAEATMKEWTRVPFKREDAPMTRIVIIKTPDNYQGIYLLGDHLVLDAQSLIGFMRDIIEIYCSTMFEGIEYPKPMRSYLEQLEKDLAYEAGSKAQQRDREFFYKRIEESEPIYNGIDGPGALERER